MSGDFHGSGRLKRGHLWGSFIQPTTVCPLTPKDLCPSHMHNTSIPSQVSQRSQPITVSTQVQNIVWVLSAQSSQISQSASSKLGMGETLGITHFRAKFLSLSGLAKLENSYLLLNTMVCQAQDSSYRHSYYNREKIKGKKKKTVTKRFWNPKRQTPGGFKVLE